MHLPYSRQHQRMLFYVHIIDDIHGNLSESTRAQCADNQEITRIPACPISSVDDVILPKPAGDNKRKSFQRLKR